MKRYEIEERSVEVRKSDRNFLKAGVTFAEKFFCEYPETIKSFNTLEEAKEAFKEEYSKSAVKELSHNCGSYFRVTEYCIAEREDKDIYVANIFEISKMTFTVVDEERNIIGIFDNYRDAEDAFREAENPLEIEYN